MRSGIFQTARHCFARAVHQKRSYRFNGAKPHARRRARGKDTVDEFFPKLCVRTIAPHVPKLIEARANLFSSRLVGSTYVCNNNRLAIRSHWIVNAQILGLRFLHCQRN